MNNSKNKDIRFIAVIIILIVLGAANGVADARFFRILIAVDAILLLNMINLYIFSRVCYSSILQSDSVLVYVILGDRSGIKVFFINIHNLGGGAVPDDVIYVRGLERT